MRARARVHACACVYVRDGSTKTRPIQLLLVANERMSAGGDERRDGMRHTTFCLNRQPNGDTLVVAAHLAFFQLSNG